MSSEILLNNHRSCTINGVRNVQETLQESIIVLFPNAIFAAGYGAKDELLAVAHYANEEGNKEWSCDFYEFVIQKEPLLQNRQKVCAVFIASPSSMVIPDALYDAFAVNDWMHSIFFYNDNDFSAAVHTMKADKLKYAYTLSREVKSYINQDIATEIPILPLAAAQIHKGNTGINLSCIIDNKNVTATLYDNGSLLWHQVFAYTTAEDIAWQCLYICKQHEITIASINIHLATISDEQYDLVSNIAQFFPNTTWGSAPNVPANWVPVVSLMQQLYSCVS